MFRESGDDAETDLQSCLSPVDPTFQRALCKFYDIIDVAHFPLTPKISSHVALPYKAVLQKGLLHIRNFSNFLK